MKGVVAALSVVIGAGCGSPPGAKPDATVPGDGAADASDASATDALPDGAVIACDGPGSLDRSFAAGGYVPSVFGLGHLRAAADVVRIEPGTGDILVGGSSRTTRDGFAGFALVRFLPDGSLDPSFGTGGITVTGVLANDCEIRDMVIQPDGKILGVGAMSVPATEESRVGLVRYDANGHLDPTFGNNGIAVSSLAPFEVANGVVLDDAGRAVVASEGWTGPLEADDRSEFVTARYTTTGALDATFGAGGVAEAAFANGLDEALDVQLQADGKIIVVGKNESPDGDEPDTFGAVRYEATGARDPDFGAAGLATVAFPDGTIATSSALDADGRLTIVGYGNASPLPADLARLNSDGSLDPTFGTGGRLRFAIGRSLTYWAVTTRDASGHFYAAGWSPASAMRTDLALGRHDESGAPDPTFGSGGVVLSSQPGTAFNSAFDLVVQGDGRIVVVGVRLDNPNTTGNEDFLVARFCP